MSSRSVAVIKANCPSLWKAGICSHARLSPTQPKCPWARQWIPKSSWGVVLMLILDLWPPRRDRQIHFHITQISPSLIDEYSQNKRHIGFKADTLSLQSGPSDVLFGRKKITTVYASRMVNGVWRLTKGVTCFSVQAANSLICSGSVKYTPTPQTSLEEPKCAEQS